MVDNIEKVLERGEKIELLVDKSENLRDRVRHAFCLDTAVRDTGFGISQAPVDPKVVITCLWLNRHLCCRRADLVCHAGKSVSDNWAAAEAQDVVAEHEDEDPAGRHHPRYCAYHLPCGVFQRRELLQVASSFGSSCITRCI